jgi:hypothetical protein
MRLEFALAILAKEMAFSADAFFDKESEIYQDIWEAIETVKRVTTSRLIEELVEHEEQNDQPAHLESLKIHWRRQGFTDLVQEYCDYFPASGREALS